MHASSLSLKKVRLPCCLTLCDNKCLFTHSSLYLVWIGGLDFFISKEKNTPVFIFIAKALLGKLPIYTCSLLSYYICNYSTRSSAQLL